jgi:hypothetical protein
MAQHELVTIKCPDSATSQGTQILTPDGYDLAKHCLRAVITLGAEELNEVELHLSFIRPEEIQAIPLLSLESLREMAKHYNCTLIEFDDSVDVTTLADESRKWGHGNG